MLDAMLTEYDTDEINIQFKALEGVESETSTHYKTFRANVTCTAKLTGERVDFPVDLLKIPLLTETGYKIDGKNKQFVGNYTLSPGWYIQTEKDKVVLKLNTEVTKTHFGGGLVIYEKGYCLLLSKKELTESKSVNLAVFLKAVTGSSFSELKTLLGAESVYINKTFSVKEPTRAECVLETLRTLFPTMVNSESKEYRLLSEGIDLNLSKLMSNMFGDRVNLGTITGKRMMKTVSFRHRCANMYLAEPVKAGNTVIKKGTFLDNKTLTEIDYSPVNMIEVETPDRKRIRIRKSDNYSFRVLGETLAETISVAGTTVEKGTVLVPEHLMMLDSSNITELAIVFGNSVRYVRRDLFNGRLKVNDIISMTQVYLNHLSGIDLRDEKYVLTNQNLITLDHIIKSSIMYNCSLIVDAMTREDIDSKVRDSLLARVLNLKIDVKGSSSSNAIALSINTNEVIELIKNVEVKESQQAELNNIIQKEAKDYRVSKSVKRSSAELVQVQQSQFGRLDQVESPESSKIGMVQARTFESRFDELGFIEAPFIRVENGVVVSEEPVYLTAEQQGAEFFADWNETFTTTLEDGTVVKKETVLAISNYAILEVPVSQVKYKNVGPFSTMSVARMQAPFPGNMNLKRSLMQANHQKQTHVPFNNQRPIVSSGGDSLIVENSIVRAVDIIRRESSRTGEPLPEDVTLLLTGSKTLEGYRTLSFAVKELDNRIVEYKVPHIIKSSSGALFSYFVNVKNGKEFKGRDIVAYNYNVDISDYDLLKHTNFGHMKINDDVFENAVATATNLVVAFKTHESSTIDDSVTLSGRVVGLDLMTTLYIHSIDYTLSDKIDTVNDAKEIESFYNVNHEHIDSKGFPKVGSLIKPRDPVIGIKTVKSSISGTKEEVNSGFVRYVFAEDNQEGVVVSVTPSIKDGKEHVEVLLAQLKPITVGDKIAGRCGNKGVIAKIVPEHLMPYDPVTGRTVDCILSPLGVPSRSNIAQTLENRLGMVMKVLGKHCILSPFKEDSYEFVRDMSAKTNVKPVKLIDPRTGTYFDRPVDVGVMYILKLEHMGTNKLKAVGLDSKLDPTFGQPSKGGGGQAIGEYETWVLSAVGAEKVLQDYFSVQSDDLQSINEMRNLLYESVETELEGENRNDDVLQLLLLSLGVYVTYDSEGNTMYRPLSDDLIRSLNKIPVDPQNKSSLSDPKIFGTNNKTAEKFYNRKRWSWLDLNCEIVHPLFLIKGGVHDFIWIHEIKEGNNESESVEKGNLNQNQMERLLLEQSYVIRDSEGEYYYYNESPSNQPGELTGMHAIVQMLKEADVDRLISIVEASVSTSKTVSGKLDKIKYLGELQSFKSTGIKPSDFIVSSLAVIPAAFRPSPKFAHLYQDFDYYYGRIMDAVSDIKVSKDANNARVRTVFLRIAEFCGLKFKGMVERNKSYKPLLKFFTGRENQDSKHGHLRESVLKKRVLASGRSVIIPSSDVRRPPTHVGIPYRMCLRMWEPKLIKLLSSGLETELTNAGWKELLSVVATNPVQFAKIVTDKALDGVFEESHINPNVDIVTYLKEYILEVTRNYVEGLKDSNGQWVQKPRVVVVGRQPSLHEFSIQALFPVITFGVAIEIHPLICTGYNADFDGDQMWVTALMNESTCEEALEKLSPISRVINNKDGELIIEHSQDIRLGMYHATMLKDNVTSLTKHEYYTRISPAFYNSIEALELDITMKNVQTYDLVVYEHTNGNKYFSTAGRILFNSLIPKGLGFTDTEFTNVLNIPEVNPKAYKNLMYDGLIAKKENNSSGLVYVEQGKISRMSYEVFDPQTNMDFYQKMSEFGFMFCDTSGASLCFEDFVEPPNKDRLVEKAKAYAAKINARYMNGTLSEEDRKRELIALYDELQERGTKDLIKSFDRNNNLFIMFDSGARGNKGQVMQACGMLGILEKAKGEALEVPVLSSYAKGLTAIETMLASFSARLGVASTQNETANSGQLTRAAVYMGGGFKIVEEDCGVEPHSLNLMFDGTGRVSLGEEAGLPVEAMRGSKVLDTPEGSYAYRHLKNFLDSDGRFTDKCEPIVSKKKILLVDTDRGRYHIRFNLDPFMTSFLTYRYAEGLPHTVLSKGDRDGKRGNYISEQTLKSLAGLGVPTVKVRTILGCRSDGGCCAKCYGLKYSTSKLPKIGENVGISSSQSIGEPAAQLTMNLFHKGGVAGASIDQGVALYQKTLSGGIPKNIPRAAIDNIGGYVSEINGPLVTFEGGRKLFTKQDVVVSVGEYIEPYEVVSEGVYGVEGPLVNPSEEFVRRLQLALTEFHYRVFESSNISVYSRHFELFAKLQTSFVTIMETDNKELFPLGSRQSLEKVLAYEGDLEYAAEVSKESEVIRDVSGTTTLLVHKAFAQTLGKIVTTGSRNSRNSWVGMLAEGQYLTGEKKLHRSLGHAESDIVVKDTTEQDKIIQRMIERTKTVVSEPVKEISAITLDELGEFSVSNRREIKLDLSDLNLKADVEGQNVKKDEEDVEVDNMSIF